MITVLLTATAGICLASSPTPIVAISNGLYVQENCPNGGPTDFTLEMVAHRIGQSSSYDGYFIRKIVQGSIHFSDNITYTGETEFEFDLTKDTVSERYITVNIPKNDTSWVMFRIVNSFRDYKYFITTKDTVEIYDNSPEYRISMMQGGPGAYMHNPNLPQPPYKEHQHSVHTGSKMTSRKLTGEELQLRRMKILERKPLTGYDAQDFVVGGQLYTRHEGETKFKKVEPIKEDNRTIEQRIQAATDSVNAIPKDSLFRACLRIDTDEQLAKVIELYGSKVQATSNPRYYHLAATRSELKILYDTYNIKYNYTTDFNHVHPDSTGERQRPIPNKLKVK